LILRVEIVFGIYRSSLPAARFAASKGAPGANEGRLLAVSGDRRTRMSEASAALASADAVMQVIARLLASFVPWVRRCRGGVQAKPAPACCIVGFRVQSVQKPIALALM